MAVILKVERRGDLRRALLAGPSLDFATVDRAVHDLWPGFQASQAKYRDEEGDACSLTEATFADFVLSAKKTASNSVLRLELPAEVPNAAAPIEMSERIEEHAEQAFAQPWNHIIGASDDASDGDSSPCVVADLADAVEMASAATAAMITSEVDEQKLTCEEPCVGENNKKDASPLVLEPLDTDRGFDPLSEADPWAMAEPLERQLDAGRMEQQTSAAAEAEGDDRATTSDAEGDACTTPSNDGFLLTEALVEAGVEHHEINTPRCDDARHDVNASSPATLEEDLVIDLIPEEKVSIVLAAFDGNGDDHLDWEEYNRLLDSAGQGKISWGSFKLICSAEEQDSEVGLSSDAMLRICKDDATLDRYFGIAKQKLEAAQAPPRHHAPMYADQVCGFMGMPIVGVAGVAPLFEDSMERFRAKVAARIRRCPVTAILKRDSGHTCKVY